MFLNQVRKVVKGLAAADILLMRNHSKMTHGENISFKTRNSAQHWKTCIMFNSFGDKTSLTLSRYLVKNNSPYIDPFIKLQTPQDQCRNSSGSFGAVDN